MKKVLLRDVAEKAGVSIAMVSYVLNGQKTDRINKDTAQRIRKVVEELNYRPNFLAQSLKLKKTFSLGFVAADIANTFSSQLARIISDEADQAGYALIIGSSDESKPRFERLINQLLNRQVDGLILAAPEGSDELIKALQDRKTPLVLIDRYFPDLLVSSVSVNNYQASFDAMSEFITQGRKKIGILVYDTTLQHLKERMLGAQDGITQSHSASYVTHVIHENHIEQEVFAAITSMLQTGVDAIYFTSNKLGIAGMRYLMNHQIAVPTQVSTLFFDETEVFDFYPSPLPFIRQPLADMGKKAVELLFQQMNDSALPPESIILETSFVHSHSSFTQ
ncbi:hypothetical protein BWI96_03920 [Siphonobacter sp. SORGH_AS_0500]|uniref:LacI family DNA-binding transcriptional regulator n=1 Tax=Siphonobacter sp. SORGH_AS_0500 TaxID=1864824 RepID=UPI000CB8AC59|nr:LacI family DNA-binding transcriptional regulator [Siphonobacter sp. SORGH_AS_0500]PKK37628.1 hypothetical protein BWI96_03920 [Siphonobacter sp. SORGH_AS_0500]